MIDERWEAAGPELETLTINGMLFQCVLRGSFLCPQPRARRESGYMLHPRFEHFLGYYVAAFTAQCYRFVIRTRCTGLASLWFE
jgi:hypothetical protein